MNNKIKKTMIVLAAVIALVSVAGIGAANAQGGSTGTAAGIVGFGPLVCSTTSYDDIAAQALNMQSPALRKALVGRQTLAQIAQSQNVPLQTVQDALRTAYEADLAQAVKDGLLSQQAYDQIKSRLDAVQSTAANATPNATADANATPNATPNAAANVRPPFGFRLFGFGVLGRGRSIVPVPAFNTVNTYAVAAKTIGIACADLVKALQGGQSIAQVASGKNVQAQAVIDALVSAQKTALAQDVQEGLRTQAQVDGQTAQLVNRVGTLVYTARPARPAAPSVPAVRRPFGFGFGNFFSWLNGMFRGNRTLRGPRGNSTSSATPQATAPATPAASS